MVTNVRSEGWQCGFVNHRLLACCVFFVAVAGLSAFVAGADEGVDSPNQTKADGAGVKLLSQYCYECHGADTQEAGIRLDTIDLAANRVVADKTLQKMLRVLGDGRMPPEDAERPTDAERSTLISWLGVRLGDLAPARRSRHRRLTVEQYNFTMQALFDVDAEFAELLPEDPISESGYRNDAERLGLSSLQMEAYLDSARQAVERYVQFGKLDQPPLHYHIELEDLFYSTADRYGTRKRAPLPVDSEVLATRRRASRESSPKYVDPLGPKLPGAFSAEEKLRAAIPKLHQQYIAIPHRLPLGELIVRVRAAGTADREGRFPRMRVEAGIALGDGCSLNKRVLGETDVTAPLDDPQTYEFRMRLEDVPTKGPLSDEDSFDRLSVFDMDQIFISNVSFDPKAIFKLGRGGYSDPATGSKRIAGDLDQMADDGVNFLHLDSLEIEMLPGVGPNNLPYRWQVSTDPSQEESEVARQFLGRFMTEAYRRPIIDEEIASKLELYDSLRREFGFKKSLQETLAAVLISPSFLFLESKPADTSENVAPHQLAAKLSYFLWLSPPDEQLSKRARDRSLLKASVFRSEAQRLLGDPRSHRFLESFCQQWLRLDKHANVAVSREAYPTYDDDLASASVQETLAYFVEVFDSDSSALDLIDSDFAMLNDRLADHYGVQNVTTGQLQRVRLPEDSVRGGLLTQASLLTMNSDGIDSHPIRRGVWLLDRLLNTPPPPPPANVPEIDENDPDFRGLSLKERIHRHRLPGSCKNCHERIDPWGMPLENFDASGRWRDNVDSTALLPSGERIGGIVELKKHLRERRTDQFAGALVHHLLTYALGRRPDYANRPQVEEIEKRFAESQYQLRELVLAIVESKMFREEP